MTIVYITRYIIAEKSFFLKLGRVVVLWFSRFYRWLMTEEICKWKPLIYLFLMIVCKTTLLDTQHHQQIESKFKKTDSTCTKTCKNMSFCNSSRRNMRNRTDRCVLNRAIRGTLVGCGRAPSCRTFIHFWVDFSRGIRAGDPRTGVDPQLRDPLCKINTYRSSIRRNY